MANIVNNCTTMYLCVGDSVSRPLLSFDHVKRKKQGVTMNVSLVREINPV